MVDYLLLKEVNDLPTKDEVSILRDVKIVGVLISTVSQQTCLWQGTLAIENALLVVSIAEI